MYFSGKQYKISPPIVIAERVKIDRSDLQNYGNKLIITIFVYDILFIFYLHGH